MELDESLNLMANENVRNISYILRETDEDQISNQKLTEEMLERGAIEEENIGNFEISMHHNYLPRLEEAGLIDYNNKESTVEYNGAPDQMEELLDAVKKLEESYEEENF